MKATRDTRGATSRKSWSHLPLNEPSMSMKPVMLPLGLAKLATKPLPTGSDTTANTIGIMRVCCWRAAVAGVLTESSTSGSSRTSSLANSCMRSTLPAPQR
jgi:hypothetical protein